METDNNRENQEERLLNNNENDKQSEEYLTNFIKRKAQSIVENLGNRVFVNKIINEISDATKEYLSKNEDLTKISGTISKIVQTNKDSLLYIVGGFTHGCISAGNEPIDISDTISNIVKDNQDDAVNIVYGFTVGCIDKGREIENIGEAINKIIQTNEIKKYPNSVPNIFYGFTQGYFSQEEKNLTKIGNIISNIVQDNQDSAFNIIYGFTYGCISAGKDLKYEDIGDTISKIIQDNQDSALNIVSGFIRGCILARKDQEYIKNAILKIMNNIANNTDLVSNKQYLLSNIRYGFQLCSILEGKDLKDIDNRMNIGREISTIIKKDEITNNSKSVSNIIDGFTQVCLSRGDNLKDIKNTFPEIVLYNQDSALNIACGFTKGCISAGQKPIDISDTISVITHCNQDSTFNIAYGFTKICLSRGEDLKDIGNAIYKIIKGNPFSACDIIHGFTRGCISTGQKPTDISDTIYAIIQTDKIKNNSALKNNIERGFKKSYILPRKDLTDIDNIISENIQDNQISTFDSIHGFTYDHISAGQKPEDISDTISAIIQTDGIKNNSGLVIDIACGFANGCISAGEYPSGAIFKIIRPIKNNSGLLLNIIDGREIGSILLRRDLKNTGDRTYIINRISKIIQNNSISAPNIIDDFTQVCFLRGENLEDIRDTISQIKKGNSNFVPNIIDSFAQSCMSQRKDLKYEDISDTISTINNTDGIKNDQDSAFNITNSAVKEYLALKPDNIEDIAKNFSNLLNEMKEETKGELKPIFSLIVSQYFINTLTNSSNKQLSGDKKKEKTEEQLCTCFNELFREGDNEKIESFKDIPLEELSGLQDEYLKERFKEKNKVDGGREYETFLKMAYNLMPKLEDDREPTVADLEKQKDIFKDLKFIRLNNNDNIKSKEDLFGKIGLTEKNFGTERGSEYSDFSIVYCTYLNHDFVMIIDKTQKWEDAINENTKSIYLIDSSRYIEDEKTKEDTPLNVKKQIFNENTLTLNNDSYQENGTCWLNAMSAVGFLLEKQQECIAEQKQKQQKQVEQTEQQEQQPRESYGLSIDDISRDFGKGQNSSFVKGICDYSTKHFYALTDISEEEKNIIKDLLREKIEQNTADQDKLSTASSRLEKSKEEQYKKSENLIIKYEHLKESFERFTQNEEKLKELCAKFKFDIKDIQLLEPKQKEDLDSEKQSADSCLGEMVIVEDISDMEKPTKYQNIPQKSNNRQGQKNNKIAKGKTQ